MKVIVGIDEVGRGCWAGPLVAAAVILKTPVPGVADSKLLTIKQRQQLAIQIKATALFGIGWVWPNQIDQYGLTIATAIAMEDALKQLPLVYDEVIIDGQINFLNIREQASPISQVKTLIKADLTVPAVSAASILAKVARDSYMCEQSVLYPNYGFEKHMGYGTRLHLNALQLFGVSQIHRLSYKPIKALTK